MMENVHGDDWGLEHDIHVGVSGNRVQWRLEVLELQNNVELEARLQERESNGFVEARPQERESNGYVEALKGHHIRHLIEEEKAELYP